MAAADERLCDSMLEESCTAEEQVTIDIDCDKSADDGDDDAGRSIYIPPAPSVGILRAVRAGDGSMETTKRMRKRSRQQAECLTDTRHLEESDDASARREGDEETRKENMDDEICVRFDAASGCASDRDLNSKIRVARRNRTSYLYAHPFLLRRPQHPVYMAIVHEAMGRHRCSRPRWMQDSPTSSVEEMEEDSEGEKTVGQLLREIRGMAALASDHGCPVDPRELSLVVEKLVDAVDQSASSNRQLLADAKEARKKSAKALKHAERDTEAALARAAQADERAAAAQARVATVEAVANERIAGAMAVADERVAAAQLRATQAEARAVHAEAQSAANLAVLLRVIERNRDDESDERPRKRRKTQEDQE